MIDIKAHDHVKADLSAFHVKVKAVDLKRPVMGHDPLRHFTAELHSLSAGVIGVHADAGQDDAGLVVHLRLQAPGEAVHLLDGHGVRQLDMDRSIVPVRPVIVEEEIIGAPHLRLLRQDPLDPDRDVAVGALAQDIVQGLCHHLNARADDKDGDHHADPCLERDTCRQENDGGSQDRGGQDRVKSGVGTGCDQ